MGTLRFILDYANDDSTLDLNNRLFGITTPGIIGPGGEITPVAGQLKVDVGTFSAITFDGATVLHDGTTRVDMVDGTSHQYVVLKAKYNVGYTAEKEISVMTVVAYNADIDKDWMQIIADIDMTSMGPPLVEVPLDHISYRNPAHRVDPFGRNPYRGAVANVGALPPVTNEKYNRIADFYLVLSTHILYYWDGSAWQPMTTIITMSSTWHNGETPAWATFQEVADGVVSDLADDTGPTGCGADRIGSEGETGVTGAGHTVDTLDLSRGSVRDQLVQLLTALNESPRIAQDETITGQWDFSNIIQLLGSTGYIKADEPGVGSNPDVMKVMQDLSDSTGGWVLYSESHGGFYLTKNCKWGTPIPDRWNAFNTSYDAHAICIRERVPLLSQPAIVFLMKGKDDYINQGWRRNTVSPGDLQDGWTAGWELGVDQHTGTSPGQVYCWTCFETHGWVRERLPFVFSYTNYGSMTIPAGHEFYVPLPYHSKYNTAWAPGAATAHTNFTIGSVSFTNCGIYSSILSDNYMWGCYARIEVIGAGITVYPAADSTVLLEGYVAVPT